MSYRQASAIELYDAGVLLTEDKYGSTAFSESGFEGGFYVFGEYIENLMRAAGIEPYILRHQETKKGRTVAITIGDEDLFFRRHCTRYGDEFPNFERLELNVEILGPSLINIKMTTVTTDEENFTEEICYSGRFTVFWFPENE